jgi:putative intracellular protease/amidase
MTNRTLSFATRLALAVAAAAPLPSCTPAQSPTAEHGKRWACKACNGACDATTYDHPGTCPVCGMPLVEVDEHAAAAAPAKPHATVAVLVFDGAEIIDFTGPWEVFGAAGYDVFTVAATREPVTTSMGMKLVPTHTFADAPAANVLLVPGGGVKGARSSEATLRWVQGESAHAEQTLSVCNGAFILGSAGLLDGLSATTTAHLLDQFSAEFPKTKVAHDRRWVDNGRIVTAGGLSSGIDGALHVVEKMKGKGAAQATALGIEYDWRSEGGFARAALADRWIPDIAVDEAGEWTVDRMEGTPDAFDIALRGTSPKSGPELHDFLAASLAKGKWQKGASTPTSSEWRFQDDRGQAWAGKATVSDEDGAKHLYRLELTLARAK